MIKRATLIIISLFAIHQSFSQSINHWEAVVNADNIWRYLPATSEPPTNWIAPDFNDNSWLEGRGGFGYGDFDDSTTVETSYMTVYIRKKFMINSIAEIEQAVLLMDYDDGFVAYLNGKEIARAGISGNPPTYDQYAVIDHEATLYQGLYPSERTILKKGITDWFVTGENLFCVQVHNLNGTSTDLTSNFFINVGLNLADVQYQPVKPWFIPPAETSTSNLPLLLVNTWGAGIPDEPKIYGQMGIIDNGLGNINSVDDPFTGYVGNIAVEIRGSSSQMFPKKQYAIELKSSIFQDTSAVVLGMPAEEDWILQGPYTDKSLMRNVLIYKLGNDLGHYAPRTVHCEFYLNGQYQGVYFMTEKIKQDKGRVNVSDLNPDENTGDDLTGGYIVKIDKFDGASIGLGWDSPYPAVAPGATGVIHFQYHYPAEDEITPQQGNYITQYVTSWEAALQAPYFRDPARGYRKYIDVESFIDFAICNEITKNVDGYRLSTYLHKDKDSKDGKLYMGPIWDFNLGFGNADYCEGALTSGWAWDFNNICGPAIPFWWKRLLQDPEYVAQFKDRWTDLRQNILSNETVLGHVDSIALALDEAQERNFTLWPILNQYVWPNSYIGGTYGNEISFLKNWIATRLEWLDNNINSLQVITGLSDDSIHQISIYPNPTAGNIHIQLGEQLSNDIEVEIIDQVGKTHYRNIFSHIDRANKAISLHESDTHLRQGFYLIRLSEAGRPIHTQKIVVN